MALDIWDTIYANLTPNTDPIDAIVSYGDYRALVYFASHNANSWKAATTASLTVPGGQTFVVLQVFFSPFETDGARDSRLFNTSTSTALIQRNSAVGYRSSIPDWTGDLTNPSQFHEVPEGETVRVEIWNTDAQKRAGGIIVIGRLDGEAGSFNSAAFPYDEAVPPVRRRPMAVSY